MLKFRVLRCRVVCAFLFFWSAKCQIQHLPGRTLSSLPGRTTLFGPGSARPAGFRPFLHQPSCTAISHPPPHSALVCQRDLHRSYRSFRTDCSIAPTSRPLAPLHVCPTTPCRCCVCPRFWCRRVILRSPNPPTLSMCGGGRAGGRTTPLVSQGPSTRLCPPQASPW